MRRMAVEWRVGSDSCSDNAAIIEATEASSYDIRTRLGIIINSGIAKHENVAAAAPKLMPAYIVEPKVQHRDA